MKVDKEKSPYLPKVAFVRLHTAGKEVKDYQQELKGQGFTFNQFKHMKKADEFPYFCGRGSGGCTGGRRQQKP